MVQCLATVLKIVYLVPQAVTNWLMEPIDLGFVSSALTPLEYPSPTQANSVLISFLPGKDLTKRKIGSRFTESAPIVSTEGTHRKTSSSLFGSPIANAHHGWRMEGADQCRNV